MGSTISPGLSDELGSPQSTTALHLSVSDLEAKHYYHGLPSKPVLVARSGINTWEEPCGFWPCLADKELKTVGNHPLKEVWEDNLALQIHNILEVNEVKWTSTDVARIGIVGESVAPIVVWIGVQPDTLPREKGLAVAKECKQLLVTNEILDVEVEIRESVVSRNVGPKLLKTVLPTYPTAELIEPLNSTLGLSICNPETPWAEGTGGFYVTGDSKLYLVTARHVVFKPDPANNDTYEHKTPSQPLVNVALFGTAAYDNYVKRIKRAIEDKEMTVKIQESRVRQLEADEPPDARELTDANQQVKKANDAIVAFNELHDSVQKDWADIDNRILGHVRFSPPIKVSAGPHKYTQDYALVEIDPYKFEAGGFTGNAIYLGTEKDPATFTRMMFPNPQNRHSFEYPGKDHMFKVRGIIQDEEMRQPTISDQNGDPCLIVMKRGNTSGLTIGRANDVLSYVCNYDDNGDTRTSKEWAIFSHDNKSGPFSDKGDSGSGIVDCLGRLGGLLTGGSGGRSCDITYATPISFILDSLMANGYKVTVEATLST